MRKEYLIGVVVVILFTIIGMWKASAILFPKCPEVAPSFLLPRWTECSGVDGTMQYVQSFCNKTTDYEWKEYVLNEKECCKANDLLGIKIPISLTENAEVVDIGAVCTISNCDVETEQVSCTEGFLCKQQFKCIGGDWSYDRCAKTGVGCPEREEWIKLFSLPMDNCAVGTITCSFDYCKIGHSYDGFPSYDPGWVIKEGEVYSIDHILMRGESLTVCVGGGCSPACGGAVWGYSPVESKGFWIREYNPTVLGRIVGGV